MDLITKLNVLGSLKDHDTRKLDSLVEGLPYKVNSYRAVCTKYGRRIVADIVDEADGEEDFETFSVFLPTRYKSLTDSDLAEMNQCSLVMTYKGKRGGANEVEFGKC